MLIARRLAWPLLSAATAAAAGALTRMLVNQLWKVASGDDVPPEKDDRSTSLPAAVGWAAGVGAAAGVSRVLSRRTAAKVWEKSTGEPPPGEKK
jgi:hypothetical protein